MGKVKDTVKGLVALVAAAVGSGCFVQHAPYATMTITSPRARQTEVYVSTPAPVQVFVPAQQVFYPGRPIVVPYYEVPVFGQECHEFAARAADSMDPNGRRVGICSGVNINPYARREWSQPFPTLIDLSDFPYNPY